MFIPNSILEVGQELEALILEVDNAKKRRISLGRKQCTDNPWKEFSEGKKRRYC